MGKIFKILDNNSIINDSRYPKFSTLHANSAIAFKNSDWGIVQNSSFTDFGAITASVAYANTSSFSVSYANQNTSSNYAEFLPFQMLMGYLGVPYNIQNASHEFAINNELINEAIIISFDEENFKNQIDVKNFFIALSGSTGNSTTAVSGNGTFGSGFLTVAPYSIKESYETGSSTQYPPLSVNPVYELRTNSDNSYLIYDSNTDSVKVDWSIGTPSVPLGYIFPEQGLILLLPSKLTAYTQLLTAINNVSAPRAENVANSIMYIGGYGLEYVEKKVILIRVERDEFNFTTNPSAFTNDDSIVRYNSQFIGEPTSYISAIGIYNDENELLAVAHLSEPEKKTELDFLTYKIVVEI